MLSGDNGGNKTVLTKGEESENEVEGGGSSDGKEPRWTMSRGVME